MAVDMISGCFDSPLVACAPSDSLSMTGLMRHLYAATVAPLTRSKTQPRAAVVHVYFFEGCV
jgi:hypothetical protein